MNTLSGVAEPYATLTLDGLNATSTLIEDAVGDYLPISGGTLQSSTGPTRLGIASNTQGTVEFTDTAGASKALMFYTPGNNDVSFTVGTNTRVLRVGGTQITAARNISMATTNKVINLAPGTTANDAVNYGQTMLRNGVNSATADIPMGGFKLTGVGIGVAGTDAATVSQLAAYLPLAGGTMTGMITSSSSTPFNFENANAPVTGRMSAGNVAVTNACTLQMNSNSASVLDFRDNTNVTKAQFKYLYGSPGSLNMLVNAVTALSTTDTLATFGVPVAMSSKKITGLLAGAAASTDAANVSQVEAADTVVTNAFIAADTVVTNAYIAADTVVTNAYIAANTAQTTAITNAYVAADTVVTNAYIAADNLRVRHDGSTAMTGSLNMNSNSVNNVVNVRSPTSTDLVLGRTGTGTEIQIKATEILIGKDITMSGANINMGTGYIGLQAGVNPTDAINKGQLDTKAYLKTSSTSNGSLTIADPSSFLTTVTFRNEYTLFGAPYGTCYFITEALAQVWIKANVTTHAKESGIQLDAGTFIFFTGDVASPTIRFNYDASVNEMNVYGRLNMRSNKIIGVTAGATATTEAVNVTQMEAADALKLNLLGGTMGGAINMGAFQITNLANGTGAQNAVTYSQTLLRNGTQAMTGQLYMGNFRIGNLSPALTNLDAVNYQQIAQSSIPLTAWRSGETVSRHFQSPALSQSLVATTVAVGATTIIMTTAATWYPAAVGNRLLIVFGCSCDAGGTGDDKFDIILKLGPTPTVKTFPYVLGRINNYRDRSLLLNTLYIVENIGVTQVEISLFNNSDDIFTLDNTNWHFSVEEIKA